MINCSSMTALSVDECGHACVCSCTCVCIQRSCNPLRAGTWPFFSVCVPQLCLTFCNPVDHSPLSLGFSSEEYWSGLPCPPPGDRPSPGVEPPSQVSCFGRPVLFLPAPALFSSSFQSRSRNFPSAAIGITSAPTLPPSPSYTHSYMSPSCPPRLDGEGGVDMEMLNGLWMVLLWQDPSLPCLSCPSRPWSSPKRTLPVMENSGADVPLASQKPSQGSRPRKQVVAPGTLSPWAPTPEDAGCPCLPTTVRGVRTG